MNGSTVSLILNNLTPGHSYSLQMACFTAKGMGPFSSMKTLNFQPVDSSRSVGLDGTSFSRNSISLETTDILNIINNNNNNVISSSSGGDAGSSSFNGKDGSVSGSSNGKHKSNGGGSSSSSGVASSHHPDNSGTNSGNKPSNKIIHGKLPSFDDVAGPGGSSASSNGKNHNNNNGRSNNLEENHITINNGLEGYTSSKTTNHHQHGIISFGGAHTTTARDVLFSEAWFISLIGSVIFVMLLVFVFALYMRRCTLRREGDKLKGSFFLCNYISLCYFGYIIQLQLYYQYQLSCILHTCFT